MTCAYDRGNQCRALTMMDCYRCPFCKTEERLERERIKSRDRLKRLNLWNYYKKLYNLKD